MYILHMRDMCLILTTLLFIFENEYRRYYIKGLLESIFTHASKPFIK